MSEKKYFEYRGVEGGVYAKVLSDDSTGITYGPVKQFAGLSEVGKSTDSSNEVHYYDNIPAIVVSSTGADDLSLNTSGIPFDMLADITGQYYDPETGMLVEQEREPAYYALGYITKKTDGTKVYVWREKGTFSIPEQTNATENDGTDANGQTLTYTGISTTHRFAKTGKPAKAVNVDTSVNTEVDEAAFFATVQTPDTVGASIGVTGVALSPQSATVTVGDTAELTAIVLPFNATNQSVTWSSSDSTVASVSGGIVTGVAAGTASITVTTADGSYTATCSVTVETE